MVLDTARAHGLDVRIDAVDDTGWDFRVHHSVDSSGARWILREPRRPEVSELIPIEAKLLDVLRPRLSVAIPRWEISSPDLVAYRRVEGTPMAAEDPATLAYTWRYAPSEAYFHGLAATLAELHRVPCEEVARTGVEHRELREEVESDLSDGIARLGVPGALASRWRSWLDDDRYWSAERCPVHGDVSPNHTLIDGAGRLTGILDWTDAALDDPAVDFAAPCLAFGPTGLDRLLSGYAAVGGRVHEFLRDHVVELTAFRFSVSLGLYGLRTGNDTYVAIARNRLA